MARRHHHVYVIELSRDVLLEPRFRKCNPGYVDGKPCVYVGMTGLDPDVRFDKHKAGIQANTFAHKYGLRLLPDLYEGFNPMSYKDAVAAPVDPNTFLNQFESTFGKFEGYRRSGAKGLCATGEFVGSAQGARSCPRRRLSAASRCR
jgi:hypothetical protein